MCKSRILFVSLFAVLICFSLSSVSAMDNLNFTDHINSISNSNFSDNLIVASSLNDSGKYSHCDDFNIVDNLSFSKYYSFENLSAGVNSSEEDLLSSVSVSNGHTYYKCGYTFKVSNYQFKKIQQAISIGKKHSFLDYGFKFKVKTNKIITAKVLVKTKTFYKKVPYEAFTYYPYKSVKLANLKNYYNNGWKKYFMGYDAIYSKKYLGYNYVKLKKTVKIYKNVKMRVYASISYTGSYDYVSGQHSYYPWVSFEGFRKGYPSKYLTGTLLM